MNSEGAFVGFIGAQAVTISAWEILWRSFQTDAQRKLTATKTSVIYNNIAISADGFIYVTTSGIEESSVAGAITGKDRTGKYAPVKMLNPSGDEIMRRNGFWPPAGEINFKTSGGVSTLVDVATGPEKTWSIVDTKREKIYTYDFNGNLLFAFGDTGTMLGSISNVCAIAYQGTKMLILDSGSKSLIVYNRTEYGDMLIQAIAAENSLDYDYAIQCWEKVLQRNSNFDAAYVGIGNALYRSADYKEALEYYEKAYDTTNWSESYKMVRKDWMSVWLLPIVGIIILLVVLVVKFLGWADKVNKRVATDGHERKKFWQELVYGFYVIFHPFDGFYDLKHEKRGSVRASLVFIAITILSFFYQGIGQGYVVNPTGATSTLWSQAISILVPLFLFVLANWCLTTLFEGEGSFKDIFIASSYSLLPLCLFIAPATLASNWVSLSEVQLVNLLISIAFVWTVLLLFCGTMITHDYPIFKNLITIVGTIVAMAFIVFLVLLFGMLLSKLISLGTNIVTEIQYRA
jgi:tetratricopeptide (TPR) repeat protein